MTVASVLETELDATSAAVLQASVPHLLMKKVSHSIPLSALFVTPLTPGSHRGSHMLWLLCRDVDRTRHWCGSG